MDDHTVDKAARFLSAPPAGAPAAARQRLGCRLGEAARLARLQGARHDQQRLRREPRTSRLRGPAVRRRSNTPPRSSPRPTYRCPRTSRTASPRTPPVSPGPCASRSMPGLAGCSIEDWEPPRSNDCTTSDTATPARHGSRPTAAQPSARPGRARTSRAARLPASRRRRALCTGADRPETRGCSRRWSCPSTCSPASAPRR